MNGFLNGIRILDLSGLVSGAYCTMQLANLGAQVIKIEDPIAVDDTRYMSPYVNGMSVVFLDLNKNKKLITLDLKAPEGRELFLEMVKRSDIVVENFAPGVMAEMGIGYEELKKVDPGIILGSISGFGQSGPYKDRPCNDGIAQAMTGIMTLNGLDGTPPLKVGPPVFEIFTGIYMAAGVLAAYIKRLRTGEGEWVETSIIDVMSFQTEGNVYEASAYGRIPHRTGSRFPHTAPFNVFPAAGGGYVYICAGSDIQFRRFCEVIGQIEMADNPLYANPFLRVKNYQELEKITSEWTIQHTAQEVEVLLSSARVPAAAVLGAEEVSKDPHMVGSRKLFVDKEDPQYGLLVLHGCPIKFSSFEPEINSIPSATLGADNAEVYGQIFGYDEQKLKSFSEKGLIN